jgi:protein TonB
VFDCVLAREKRPRRRLGLAVAVALLVHGAGAVIALRLLAAAPARERDEVAVTFVRAAPAPRAQAAEPAAPRPPPVQRPRPRRAPAAPRTVLPAAIVAPVVVPDERPAEAEPAAAPPGGVDDGGGGEVAAIAGGVKGEVADAADVGPAPVEFDDRMTRPSKLAGPDPQYTPQAIEREIEGTMLVRCVVTVQGEVRDCRIVKGLPYLDEAVVAALERRRYRPATLGGRPIDVDYLFRITLRLP